MGFFRAEFLTGIKKIGCREPRPIHYREILNPEMIPSRAGDLTELGSDPKVLSDRFSAENLKVHSVLASFWVVMVG